MTLPIFRVLAGANTVLAVISGKPPFSTPKQNPCTSYIW